MKKILWIDDDEKLIDSSTSIFESHGFHVFKATNTSRALTMLRSEHATLSGVLLDVKLQGDENGLELLEELTHHYPTVEVAIFTAYPEFVDQVKAIETGASVYFTKIDKSIPLDPEKQRSFFDSLHQVFPGTKGEENVDGDIQLRKPVIILKDLTINNWWFVSILTGFIVGVLATLLIPSKYGTWRLPVVLGAITTAVMLVRNPKFRYMKAFWIVFAALSTWNLLPGIDVFFNRTKGNDETTFSFILRSLDWPVNIGLIVLLIVLLYFDFCTRSTRKE